MSHEVRAAISAIFTFMVVPKSRIRRGTRKRALSLTAFSFTLIVMV
jgi:hypothetical protein